MRCIQVVEFAARIIKKKNSNDFYIITRIKESKTLTRYVLCDYKFKFNGENCNSNQNWNNEKY